MHPARVAMRSMLGARLPKTEGAITVPGIERPVVIRRDRYGVPHIEASTDGDAWFGLGFCQGQDRGFQLEMLLRVIRGRVAELVGAAALPVDRLARRIGFKHAARATEELLVEEERSGLAAFAAGVVAGTRLGLPRLPHEFALLRCEPTPYEASDAIAVVAFQAFALASNWDAELARLTVYQADGAGAVADLDPAYPEWHPVTAPVGSVAGPAVAGLLVGLERLRGVLGGGGSNNWALAGSRTATGRPLVANDPHLAPVLPPHLYLAHVAAPQWSIAGACVAGTPGFIAGHNGHVAWGVTAGLVDNTDLFVEEVGPDGASVRDGDAFVPCEVRREVIRVKGAGTVAEDVIETPRGPIVSPALGGDTPVLSMAATWLRPARASALPAFHRARSFEDLRGVLRDFHGPPLNVVGADTSGAIGWQMIGQAPRRRSGVGAVPLPGWAADTGWEAEPVPYEDLPAAADPETGYIATANNRPTAAGGAPFLSIDWIDGYRQARIAETLADRGGWDVADTMRFQLDTFCVPWREMREVVLGIGMRSGSAAAMHLLREWDGHVGAASPAAAVFELFVAEMARRIGFARAPRSATAALGAGFTSLVPNNLLAFRRTGHLVRLVTEQPHGWFERSWSDELADALAAVERDLRRRFGDDPGDWEWGRLRPLELRHAMGERKPLDRVFNLGPFPWGGDLNTVAQAGAVPLDPLGNPGAIAALRMVVDVGDWERSRFALPGGQSGNPLSPHYDDQLPMWREGTGVAIAWSPEAMEAAAQETLHLVPE